MSCGPILITVCILFFFNSENKSESKASKRSNAQYNRETWKSTLYWCATNNETPSYSVIMFWIIDLYKKENCRKKEEKKNIPNISIRIQITGTSVDYSWPTGTFGKTFILIYIYIFVFKLWKKWITFYYTLLMIAVMNSHQKY